MWELDHKEGWAMKDWCFWTVVLEKTLESPLDCKKMKPVNPKWNQSWIFIGRTDAEAKAIVLWPSDAKSWLIRKDPDAGKNWRQEEKGRTEDEMVGWHHWLNGHEFEQAPGDGEGQGCLAWRTKSQTWLSDWTAAANIVAWISLFSISFFLGLNNISLYEFTTCCLSIHLFMEICTFSLEIYLFKSCAHLLIGVLECVCSIIWVVGLYQICNCKYSSHFGDCLYTLLSVLWYTKVFNFDAVSFFLLYFLVSFLRNHCQIQKSWGFTSMFLSKSFIILALLFRSLIYWSKLYFLYVLWGQGQASFLCMNI